MKIHLDLYSLSRFGLSFAFSISLIFLSSHSAFSTEQPTLSELESLQGFEQTLLFLDQVQTRIEMKAKERKYKCLLAFGHEPFCQCLNQNLSADISFEKYVLIVTRTEESLRASNPTADNQKFINHVRNTREQCALTLQ